MCLSFTRAQSLRELDGVDDHGGIFHGTDLFIAAITGSLRSVKGERSESRPSYLCFVANEIGVLAYKDAVKRRAKRDG